MNQKFIKLFFITNIKLLSKCCFSWSFWFGLLFCTFFFHSDWSWIRIWLTINNFFCCRLLGFNNLFFNFFNTCTFFQNNFTFIVLFFLRFLCCKTLFNTLCSFNLSIIWWNFILNKSWFWYFIFVWWIYHWRLFFNYVCFNIFHCFWLALNWRFFNNTLHHESFFFWNFCFLCFFLSWNTFLFLNHFQNGFKLIFFFSKKPFILNNNFWTVNRTHTSMIIWITWLNKLIYIQSL